ncbi:unnamed protein product [Darwinula stevensoni]|uniref:Uncharacterized protein n=1 Tax=Darwinula stevensoni TaxID=69355 RepID=A0A7R8XA38_9CRUS|nr:unnamed protein product [Darwinula stevensoni]CAG0886354.1 unnamed protein product [Darwinula stevensoni]
MASHGVVCSVMVKDFKNLMGEKLLSILTEEFFVDVHLVCGSHMIATHKVILAACSQVFRDHLLSHPHVSSIRLESFGLESTVEIVRHLLILMYHGRAEVPGNKISDVLTLAQALGVNEILRRLELVPPGTAHEGAENTSEEVTYERNAEEIIATKNEKPQLHVRHISYRPASSDINSPDQIESAATSGKERDLSRRVFDDNQRKKTEKESTSSTFQSGHQVSVNSGAGLTNKCERTMSQVPFAGMPLQSEALQKSMKENAYLEGEATQESSEIGFLEDVSKNIDEELTELTNSIVKQIQNESLYQTDEDSFTFKVDKMQSQGSSGHGNSNHVAQKLMQNQGGHAEERDLLLNSSSRKVQANLSNISIQTDIEMIDMESAFHRFRKAKSGVVYTVGLDEEEDDYDFVGLGDFPDPTEDGNVLDVEVDPSLSHDNIENLNPDLVGLPSGSQIYGPGGNRSSQPSFTAKRRKTSPIKKQLRIVRVSGSDSKDQVKHEDINGSNHAESDSRTSTSADGEKGVICPICNCRTPCLKKHHARVHETRQRACTYCNEIFQNHADLLQHVKSTHFGDRFYKCCKCSKPFISKEAMKVHLWRLHGIGNVFRCHLCPAATPVKSSYMKHLQTHKTVKDLICKDCGKLFKSKGGLNSHLKSHQGEDVLFKCGFCPFKTIQKFNLTKHLASQHQRDLSGNLLKNSFACPDCDFTCVAEHILKTHRFRKHTADKPWKCTMCDYSSVEKAALEKHVRIRHTHERPYICEICGFSTHTLSGISRHRRAHEGSKPHKCPKCGQSYADKKRLNDHLLKHSDQKPFKCHLCHYACRRKDNLQIHVRKNHGVSLPVPHKASQAPSHSPQSCSDDASKPINSSSEKSCDNAKQSEASGEWNIAPSNTTALPLTAGKPSDTSSSTSFPETSTDYVVSDQPNLNMSTDGNMGAVVYSIPSVSGDAMFAVNVGNSAPCTSKETFAPSFILMNGVANSGDNTGAAVSYYVPVATSRVVTE